MLTGKQVALGLAGGFIVNDTEEAALGLPSGTHEVPLVLRDTTLDTSGNMLYKPRSGGFEGQIPLVNGTQDPYLAVDTALLAGRALLSSRSWWPGRWRRRTCRRPYRRSGRVAATW